MKNFDKNKETSYVKYWVISTLYGWTMSQKLPFSSFSWAEETCKFNEVFLKGSNIRSYHRCSIS